MKLSFDDYVMAFSQDEHLSSLTGIGRGIEREGLRVLPEGRLSLAPHHKSLGAALTHPNITTDYSETLLEFITPVSFDPETTIAQLQDIQKYTLSKIDGELLWPMSMPCFVDNDDAIPLANYGSSNVGQMKTAYRQGLKNRYGSMMQVISGIHFNFSFSQGFWQSMQKISENKAPINDFISEKYFSLLRNYKRYCWLIPYLYGSSPTICGSFLKNKTTTLPFKKSASGYMYLEYATSLRMSDLGYTNSEQASLKICYNDLSGYLDGVQNAINLPSEKFAAFGVKVNGKYQQLNSNILQIENELYAPIRPKQVAKSGEKPSEALRNRGVEYIEVRALDVNPFSDTGISIEQVYFLDVFITYCALADSPLFTYQQQESCDANMDEVVVRGRDPLLLLNDNGCDKSVKAWGSEIFQQMEKVAILLDSAYGSDKYSQAVANEQQKLLDPNLTPSAQLLDCVVNQNQSLTGIALQKAQDYRQQLLAADYQVFNEQYFIDAATKSHQGQKDIENADQVDFDTFLADYFGK
ncbi:MULTISPECIES: glutamate--cysteine ligase [unclassified Colwellia]|uniref:glutamate--cysteine ligase n=1 Tax=unclassified Colwellia TaxID=196834 RepID=UPI002873C8D0|nr:MULTISPECIES: glutamate--cysteine ligase [unclassified Colwellia]